MPTYQHSKHASPLGSPSCTRQVPPAAVDSDDEPIGIPHKGWYSRGYLPHRDAVGLCHHITFHLADSLPGAAVERLQVRLDQLPEDRRPIERRRRLQDLLDSGQGACVLGDMACARLVEDSLHFGDGNRYRLLEWCIMPNHLHVLIEQAENWALGKIIQSWKRHTTREIHRMGASPSACLPANRLPRGSLWQRDYWDRYIRDETHYATVVRYIHQNPVKAHLVECAQDWPWSSARFGTRELEGERE